MGTNRNLKSDPDEGSPVWESFGAVMFVVGDDFFAATAEFTESDEITGPRGCKGNTPRLCKFVILIPYLHKSRIYH